jgi:hypothetical protein
MRKQVEASQRSELTDVTAKAVIYEAVLVLASEIDRSEPATLSQCHKHPSLAKTLGQTSKA